MARALLTGRVSDLEHRMEAIERRFDGLDAQISQFRDDMRVALAATNSRIDDLRTEVAASRVEFQQRIDQTHAHIDRGDEETRRYMRVLHEEVIERLKWIQEG